jgi:hypothetical protein
LPFQKRDRKGGKKLCIWHIYSIQTLDLSQKGLVKGRFLIIAAGNMANRAPIPPENCSLRPGKRIIEKY